MLEGGQAEGLACADLGAKNHSGNSYVYVICQYTIDFHLLISHNFGTSQLSAAIVPTGSLTMEKRTSLHDNTKGICYRFNSNGLELILH
jgi:hypothetical protein